MHSSHEFRRLKSGDPFIFGNGGETVQFILSEIRKLGNNTRLEIIPGISSGLGATAQLGIPLTHSGVPSSLCLISGHHETNVIGHDYQHLSNMGTLVFYMSLRSIQVHREGLLKAGRNGKTPVCMIERGGHSNQRVVKSNLENICRDVIKHKIQEPVIFVIGEVVNFSPFI